MSAIEKASASIKKKMSLLDYEIALPQSLDAAKPQKSKAEKQQKVKLSIYLTEEAVEILNQLLIEQIKKTGKPDRSKVISDALVSLSKDQLQK